MRQMSGYWEPTAGGGWAVGWGGTSLLLLVGFALSPLTPFPLMASRSFFLLQTCERAHVKTHTYPYTYTPLTPPPPPLVLIIPLQIRRSISSCIIVSPPTRHPHLPSSSPFKSGERSCPLSPCQPRWPGSPGSHIPSWPIRALSGDEAQLDDSVLPEERR